MKKNSILINIVAPILSVICSLIAGSVFILIIGENPLKVYAVLFGATFGCAYGTGQLLFYATPLIFTGLAVAFAFRTGLFNIGGEGQLYIGSLLCAYVAWLFTGLPAILLVPISIVAAIIGGAFWGFIPGMLKAKTGAHEVITTIMLNFIALAFTNYIIANHFFVAGTVRTPAISASAQIPRFFQLFGIFRGSPVNVSFLLALITAAVIYYILWQSKLGYELRATGHNPSASKYGGINITKNMVITMLISGGLAGMAGINFVMGYKHFFEQGFSGGVGFMGIAVALLGKNHPIGVVFAAILFGALSFGGLMINHLVPKELVDILQAIVILFVVIGNTVFSRMLLKRAKKNV